MRFLPIVLVLITASCTHRAIILAPEPSGNLRSTVSQLQRQISDAEANGCRIKAISHGLGHGVGVGHGLGLGAGIGVGIRIEESCPDCVADDLNETASISRTERNTVVQSNSVFSVIALAQCPAGVDLNQSSTSQ